MWQGTLGCVRHVRKAWLTLLRTNWEECNATKSVVLSICAVFGLVLCCLPVWFCHLRLCLRPWLIPSLIFRCSCSRFLVWTVLLLSLVSGHHMLILARCCSSPPFLSFLSDSIGREIQVSMETKYVAETVNLHIASVAFWICVSFYGVKRSRTSLSHWHL